ncbi:family 78 glycoside hydrolase catalytic domain [Virgisporangium ochraceum]
MPLTHRRAWRTASLVAALVAALLVPSPIAAQAAPAGLDGAHWIWYPEGDPRVSVPAATRYLRTRFTVHSGAVSEAQFVVTGDDTVDVWVNGKPVGGSPRVGDSWRRALYLDLRAHLTTGTNTIAVAARNTAAGPAGLLGRLRVVAAGGTTDLVTDATWKAGQNAVSGWEQPGFADSGWPAARDSGAYGVSPWSSDVTAPDPDAPSPLTVVSATVERKTAPLGVDAPRPRFGWKLASTAQGQRQAGYELTVSTTAAHTGDVWTTGRVSSAQQVDVVYGGPALTGLTRYYWRVRAFDAEGRTGPWSATQSFETGTQWTAEFIGRSTAGLDLAGASWIWYPEGDPAAGVPAATRYFRRTLGLAGAPASGQLVVTGDDTADVWVNGVQVSASPRVTDSWRLATVVDLRGRLVAGTNTIAVAADNTTQSPAGLVAKLTVSGGTTVVTDAAWKASQNAPAGWTAPGFDDSGWPAARAVATYGSGPWASGVAVSGPAPLLRKGFTVDRPVRDARLLTTALGLHETRLNGAKVGADVLAPGWTDYAKRLQYTVHDVTGQLRQGANALGAWLGNGWYSGSLGFAGNQRYGTQPWYSALLVVTYTDGTTATVRTDSTWRTTSGPIRADDLYHGETYDARLAIANWDRPGYDDSTWEAVQLRTGPRPTLVSQVDNGATVQREFTPVSVTQPQPGRWVYDLGQNFSGWTRIAASGTAGTTLTIRHAEVLNPDGTLYTANLRAAQATDRFTLAGTGATETYEPRFTVHGFRYVEVTGSTTAPTVTGRAAWTTGAQPGTLTTSNALVNQLQHNILWGERRDERLGWTGDIAIFAATSTFNLDMQAFLDKYTDDLVDAQRADGAFTDVAPNVCCGAGAAGWGDAGVIVPYTLWQRYGDLRVVDENFAAMARWVDYLRATSGADLIRDQTTYGDWLNVNDNTAQDLISTAFFGWSARLVSRMAAATGRGAQAVSYGGLADRVAAAFAHRFVAADGTVSGNTQTGYVLALAFGLTGNRTQAVADRLVARVNAAGGHLTVGFLGVENLLPVLADNGHAATAYQILLQPGFPGWGYMNSRGATTIWERWDGIRPDGSFNDPGMNSFNHYGMGSVGDFLYRRVGGVEAAAPGYSALRIAPLVGGGLTSAAARFETPHGLAVSDWAVSGGVVTLRVSVPAGVAATVTVPGSGNVTAPAQAVPMGARTYHVGSGAYTFTG